MDPDLMLLRRYGREGDQKAFEELVGRHVNTVYASALRQVRSSHDAEDVTQAVFLLLSSKAKKLSDRVMIGGWLILATRFTAKEFLRAQRRRTLHEQRAAAMKSEATSAAEIESVLDEALTKLGAKSRGVLVMRYLEGRDSQDVAQVLGISEDAARKRISRALGELRSAIAGSGVIVSEQVLGEDLAHASAAAPAGLAAASAAAKAAKPTAAALAKAAAMSIALGSAKMIVGGMLIAAALVAGTVGVTKVVMQNNQTPALSASAPTQTAVTITMLSGVVYGLDQTPVADADVAVATEAPFDVYHDNPQAPKTRTDAQGRYSLPMPRGAYSVVVRGAEGFAEISSEAIKHSGANIVLKPWARIEGVAMIGATPAARRMITLIKFPNASVGRGNVSYSTTVRSDDQGRFVFELVPPGQQWLGIAYSDRSTMPPVKWDYEILNPGQVLKVTVGGQGRPVVGYAVLPSPTSRPLHWSGRRFSSMCTALVQHKNPPLAILNKQTATPEEQDALMEKWGRTDEGRRWNLDRQIRGTINEDGTFRFDDVEPGDYVLGIEIEETTPSTLEAAAAGSVNFTVPPMEGGRSDVPLDIGALQMKLLPWINPGDAAPDFTVKTLDGQNWTLSEHRGKPVVLMFWESMDLMKDFSREINPLVKDGRISALGVDLSAVNEDVTRKNAAQYEMNWPQTIDQKIVEKYKMTMPGAVVIDAKDRIVQRSIWKPQLIQQYVREAEQAQ